MSRPPARVTSPVASIMSPTFAADRKSPERFTVTLGTLRELLGDGEAGEVGEGEQAAAVHEAAAIHVARLGR